MACRLFDTTILIDIAKQHLSLADLARIEVAIGKKVCL